MSRSKLIKQNSENLEIMRHSLAHLMAAAVSKMLPGAKLAIGPAIDNGFYYDFDLPTEVLAKAGLPKALTPEDLPKIEKIIKDLISQKLPFEKKEVEINEGIAEFKNIGQTYKVELLEDLKKEGEKKVTLYQTGRFLDLCRGPHIADSSQVGAFKLTHLAGAYWKGDEKNKMLTRIYGVAFASQAELDNYLKTLVEAEKRDHRKIGRELELFHIDENVGKGLPLWMPKGAMLRQTLERFIEDEETKRGYLRTYTPVIGNVRLYKISGHWDHYKDDMYPAMKIENEEYVLRPMTCPHQFMIYKANQHSYKDLPLRYAELAEMYRREKSGELSGLARVMGFTLNDAHIICTPGQLEQEFLGVLDLVKFSLKVLGLDKNIWFRASLRDKEKAKYLDNEKLWNESEKILLNILKKAGVKYETGLGDAAFYGPKADIQIKNVHGKEETLITIQIDLNSAERFDMVYIDEKGKKQRPVIIHRSAIGCIERTVAFLIEHYAGAFPTWLAPIQIKFIPVGSAHLKYCQKLAQVFKDQNLRVEVDELNETVGYKIRKAEKQKVPYMLVIGDKEIKGKTLNVRHRDEKEVVKMAVKKFIERVRKEIENRS